MVYSVLCFSVFLFFQIETSTRGSLYAATVADFSATDSLIIKNQLRTEQYDYMHLNSPDFVGSLEDEEHVYFFFREAAVEFMNCGKAVYSRVARVCKNDEGGSHKFANRWSDTSSLLLSSYEVSSCKHTSLPIRGLAHIT